jgi:hypothetical protein
LVFRHVNLKEVTGNQILKFVEAFTIESLSWSNASDTLSEIEVIICLKTRKPLIIPTAYASELS